MPTITLNTPPDFKFWPTAVSHGCAIYHLTAVMKRRGQWMDVMHDYFKGHLM
jgi:hypothetical protein